MRVLVCGDRYWSNEQCIYERLRNLEGVTLIIHGGERGADIIAGQEAEKLGYPVRVFRAHWNRYGRAAGPIRNQQMLDVGRPDFVLAFHNNLKESKGTRDMVQRASKAGVEVEVCRSL